MDVKVAVLVILGIGCAYAAEEPKMEVVLSAAELPVGKDLFLECRSNLDLLSSGKFVKWIKILPNADGGNTTTKYTMGANTIMEEPFKRYTVDIKEEGRQINLYLNISAVTAEDSGRLGCEVSGNSGQQDTKEFTVLVPPSSVEMKFDGVVLGDELDLKQGQKGKLTCEVKGSNPQAEVKVKVGDMDITDLFTQQATKKLTPVPKNGKQGLAKITNDVILSNTAFAAEGSYVGKNLTCTASVPNLIGSPMTQSTMLKMKTTPQFACSAIMDAFEGQEDYDIKCTITCDPPLLSVNWAFIKGENDTVVPINKKFALYTVKSLTKNSAISSTTVLHIKRVHPQHFRIYRLTATNSLGNSSIDIRLNEIKNPGYSVSRATSLGNMWSLCFVFLASAFVSVRL